MADPGWSAGDTISAIVICGTMGLLGQGVRAVVGLKNANALSSSTPDNQTEFRAAYLFLSLMIGAIAGILAGLVTGLATFMKDIHLESLLGIAASGYVGADFVENSMSLVLPKSLPSAGSRAEDGKKAKGDANGEVKDKPKVDTTGPEPDTTSSHTSQRGLLTPEALLGAPDDPLSAALHAVAPGVNLGKWIPALQKAFVAYDLNTDKRKAAAVGQFLVEAGADFGEVAENLYYTHVAAVMRAFGSHFADEDEAKKYLRNPTKLANRVYANRLGNGDEASGDGYRYRGRGLIQLTGKTEYQDFAETIHQSAEAASAYCETAEGAAMSGCWYLSSRKCLPHADRWEIDTVTLLVNGRKMLGRAQRLSDSNAMLKQLRATSASE